MKKNLVVLLVTLVMFFGFTIKANASGVTVATFNGNDIIQVGDVSFNLNITGVSGSSNNELHSYGGYIVYDPQYLEFVSFEGTNGWTANLSDNRVPGKIKVATVDWPMENGVTSGNIGTAKFKALKPGETILAMDDIEATNTNENIHASFVNKHLIIKEAPKVSIKSAQVSGITNRYYNGKAQIQNIKVTYNGKTLINNTDYKVTYKNNINAGTASVIITGYGIYGDTLTKTFTINKLNNPMVVVAKSKKVKYKKVKKKKQVLSLITLAKQQGIVTYSKVSGPKKIVINKTTGKITVKKKIKKGTYYLNVKVTAAGNINYKAIAKIVTIKIIVK